MSLSSPFGAPSPEAVRISLRCQHRMSTAEHRCVQGTRTLDWARFRFATRPQNRLNDSGGFGDPNGARWSMELDGIEVAILA
jgi:hypothetical protein